MSILTSFLQPISHSKEPLTRTHRDLFRPLRHWVDQIQIKNRWSAHLLCRIIPNSCPFEREFSLFGHTIHTPALCTLNPFYHEVVSLRFRALTYLADTCGEDITQYTA